MLTIVAVFCMEDVDAGSKRNRQRVKLKSDLTSTNVVHLELTRVNNDSTQSFDYNLYKELLIRVERYVKIVIYYYKLTIKINIKYKIILSLFHSINRCIAIQLYRASRARFHSTYPVKHRYLRRSAFRRKIMLTRRT